MAKLSTKARKALPTNQFAGPNRSYPIPDRSHAINAEARATQYASPVLKSRVQAAVKRAFPGLGKGR